MVNVQNFVTVMVVTTSLSMVCLIMALFVLVRISCDVDRIYHYSTDIYGELEEINHDYGLILDDCRSNTIVLHSIEQKIIRDIPSKLNEKVRNYESGQSD